MPVAKIDPKKCNGCGRCVDTCPEDVFRLNIQPVNVELKSPCAKGCPAKISVRKYSYYVEMGMMDEAYKELKAYNPFPAVTGRICPHPCESECARKLVDEAVNINCLERYVADYFKDAKVEKERVIYAGKVAIIGSGPAGLSAAYYLCQKGFSVTVFEKEKIAGGMLSLAIPDFRLPRTVVKKQIQDLLDMGVEIKCGVEVGKDVTIDSLKKEGYEAFYIAIGLHNGGKLGVPGEDAEEVIAGVDFMKSIYEGNRTNVEGDVVVIGGGNIGADVARTAKRLGAKSVKLFALESYDSLPMGKEDRTACEKDGIEINAGWGQTNIDSKGVTKEVKFHKCLSVLENGKFNPKFDDSQVTSAKCQTLLYCIGQKPKWGNLLVGTNVVLNERNLAKADKLTNQTADKAIFVGGDVFLGQKFVVDAIAGGREAAESISRYLTGKDLEEGRRDDLRVEYPPKEDIPTFPRQTPSNGESFTQNEAFLEAQRCMTCGARCEIKYPEDCMVCLYCMRDCPQDAITITPDRIAKHIEPWDLG